MLEKNNAFKIYVKIQAHTKNKSEYLKIYILFKDTKTIEWVSELGTSDEIKDGEEYEIKISSSVLTINNSGLWLKACD